MGKCEKCMLHKFIDGEWVCNNPESENYGLETEYSHGCVDWIDKECDKT